MNSLTTELIFWLILPGVVAVGAAYLVFLLMQARIHVITANFQAAVAKVESGGAGCRGVTDELLADLRFERHRFLRRVPIGASYQTSVVTQERIYFRNIPLTGWMEEELPLGEGEILAPEVCTLPMIPTVALQAVPVSLSTR
ncbi:MAG: hypothetical protein C5B51_30490 [Terriglobia bacterium]|nr:MAG: hypothetical protein C5B51_30490 [Terriglobia bacterium]